MSRLQRTTRVASTPQQHNKLTTNLLRYYGSREPSFEPELSLWPASFSFLGLVSSSIVAVNGRAERKKSDNTTTQPQQQQTQR